MTSEYNNLKITSIKWMCFDVIITDNKTVFNRFTGNKLALRVKDGCYGYTVNGTFRSNKWINENCVNIGGLVSE